MRTQLKKGSVVDIYTDPISKKNLEGRAKLVKQISYDPSVERWHVRFDGDYETVIRWIFP